MKPKPIDSLDALHVPELGVGAAQSAAVAVSLAASIASSTAVATSEGEGLKQRIAGSLGRGGRFGIFVDRLARLFGIPLERAADLVKRIESGTSWRPGPADGIQMISVRPGPAFPDAIAIVGRLRPGSKFPRHAHLGDETTLVLAGGFRDSSGVEIERGEELFEAAGTEHEFIVLDGEDCIAAVIAVGGVDFK